MGRVQVESREWQKAEALIERLVLGSRVNFAGEPCAMIISGIFSHFSGDGSLAK